MKPEDPKGTMAFVLELKHKAHLNICARGIPCLNSTEFKNTKDYNSFMKRQLEKGGLLICFVSVYQPALGDRRGSTFARIGCFKEEQSQIMIADLWPKTACARVGVLTSLFSSRRY